MGTNQEASITIRAYDKASYAVLGVAANLETLNKRMARTSQIGYAFGQVGKQLAPAFERMSQLGDKWGAAFRRVSLAGVAIGGAAAGLVGFAKSAADAADKIGDLSSRYQIGSETLQVYGAMVEAAGGSMEDAAAGIGKFKKAMNEATHGGKEQAEAFAGLGISLKQLKKMTPEEAMLKMSEAFKGSEKDMAKQAILLQLMGKNGTIFMDAMNQGPEEFKRLMAEMRADGRLLTKEQQSNADRFDKSWRRMTGTLEGVKNKIGLSLATKLEPLLNKFQVWLAGDGGKRIAAEFDKIFTSENIETFVDALKGVWTVVKAVASAFKTLIDFIGPTATMFLVASVALAPLASALISTATAMGSVLKVTLAIANAFPILTTSAGVAGLAIFAAFKAYQAYQRLSETQDRVAADTGVRADKRAAYDDVLRSVGGEKFAAAYGKNTDFQTLDTVVSGLERGGKVATGTAARLAAMPVDVSGTLKIEVNSTTGQSKVTEIKKAGALDFAVSTGPLMQGG